MRKKNLKFKNINIKFGNTKLSRFIIDLKKDLEQQASENITEFKLEKNKISKIKQLYFHFVKKFFLNNKKVEMDYGSKLAMAESIPLIAKERTGVRPNNTNCFVVAHNDKNKLRSNEHPNTITKKKNCFAPLAMTKGKNIIKQLAFVELIVFVYKLCFYVGYITLYLTKFCYFALIILLKMIIKPFELLIVFIGKISFYLIAEIGKINYAFWSIIIKSWNTLIVKKVVIAKKIFKQIKFYIFQNVKFCINIFCQNGSRIKSIMTQKRNLSIKSILPRPNLTFLRPVGFFALILLILILPFKIFTYYKSINNVRAQVLSAGEQAFGQFLSASKSVADLDFSQAQENFSKAGNDFLSAQTKLNEINNLLLTLSAFTPDKNLRLAAISKRILRAGQLSSDLGKNLSLIMEKIVNNKDKNFKEILDNIRLYGNQAASQALELNNLLLTINEKDLPNQYRQQFNLLKEKTTILSNSLTEIVNLTDKLDSFFGATFDKRYLLVFQNNTELRASGGFIGSFALLDFSKGKLKNIEVLSGGSYDIKAGMLDKIIAPQPLQLIAPQWYFWDANWWADWPTSANKLKWFYEKSDGPTVDGVISLTPTVIEELLKIIGPIDMTEQYGTVFNADNFWIKTQELAEQKDNKQSKKIIGDLMNKIFSELPKRVNKDNLASLLKITDQLFSSKQILFYFVDPELQKKTVELGWDGGFKKTSKDYLSVINTNIAGGKSDRKIEETIDHQAEIMPDKTIIDTIKITRTHTGIKREPFSGIRNVDWMRIYVPQGSQLISAEGFKTVDKIYFKEPEISWKADPDISQIENNIKIDETSNTKIYDELGKTVFANWSQVDPGQSIVITLKYKLPFKIDDIAELTNQSIIDKTLDQALHLINLEQKQLYPYSLLIQKQPGAKADKVTSNLVVNNFSAVWKYPKELSVNKVGWQVSDNLNSDKFWATLLENK